MKFSPQILLGILLTCIPSYGKDLEKGEDSSFVFIVVEDPLLEEIIYKNPSSELIDSTVNSLDWSESTIVILEKNENEKIVLQGRLDLPRGLRMIYYDSSGKYISDGPPVSLESGANSFKEYLSGKPDWKESYKWKDTWRDYEEFDFLEKDWWYLMELSDTIGCYFDEPKTLGEFSQYLPDSEDQYGWCCTQSPVELNGQQYEISSFKINTPDYLEGDLYFEFLMDNNNVGFMKEEKIYSVKIYTHPRGFPSGAPFYLLNDGHEADRFLCVPTE